MWKGRKLMEEEEDKHEEDEEVLKEQFTLKI